MISTSDRDKETALGFVYEKIKASLSPKRKII